MKGPASVSVDSQSMKHNVFEDFETLLELGYSINTCSYWILCFSMEEIMEDAMTEQSIRLAQRPLALLQWNLLDGGCLLSGCCYLSLKLSYSQFQLLDDSFVIKFLVAPCFVCYASHSLGESAGRHSLAYVPFLS